ncbi:MgtC/SapB family protein [Pedobacter faecalis]|uniref:MgtC/SapB family protein n=1 Tax=Pedobacter faecalis TaxID=3041495 RepID=UPI002549C924|nr:MgtC/SapB family protein [Pedobacter sp. ELA7]
MELISVFEIILRLVVAMILGAAVGFERERNEWAAGLRTHTLVSVGSALAMIVSTYGYSDVLGVEGFDVDPSRVAAQVISGVGFLGAGTILFLKQEVVKGLTTAAALWSIAAVGLACGGGMYVAAIAATFLMLFVLAGVKWLERRFLNREPVRTMSVKISAESELSVMDIETILARYNIEVRKIAIKASANGGREIVVVFSKFNSRNTLMKMMNEVYRMAGVDEVDL